MNYKSLLGLAIVGCLTLGLAPYSPEPHIVGKIRWILGGGEGMQLMDYLDLLLHSAPWLLLIVVLLRGKGRSNTLPLADILAQENVHIIDVRESNEVAAGMIDGAHHMPLSSFDRYIQKIESMEGPKVLYCRSGNRSGRAISKLKQRGMTDLYNGGGYSSMKQNMNK